MRHNVHLAATLDQCNAVDQQYCAYSYGYWAGRYGLSDGRGDPYGASRDGWVFLPPSDCHVYESDSGGRFCQLSRWLVRR